MIGVSRILILARVIGRPTVGVLPRIATICRVRGHATIKGLPDSMLACQILEYNKPHQIRKIATPRDLGPHELLLKIAAASLCHSDLEYQDGALDCALPVTASHEATGVVLAKGGSVARFDIGDRIMAGQTFDRCGECEDCKGPESYQHYCEHQGPMMSTTRNGAFQEYLVVDARQACRIPDEISFLTAAPLACAGITIWRAILQAELKAGQWLGIVGSGGGLGHLGVQFAKAKGLRVIGTDAREEGLALSREVGADLVLDARMGKEEVVRQILAATGGKGVDATITTSGASAAVATACGITRRHGTMVYVPVVSTAYHLVVSDPAFALLIGCIQPGPRSVRSVPRLDFSGYPDQRFFSLLTQGGRRNVGCRGQAQRSGEKQPFSWHRGGSQSR